MNRRIPKIPPGVLHPSRVVTKHAPRYSLAPRPDQGVTGKVQLVPHGEALFWFRLGYALDQFSWNGKFFAKHDTLHKEM